MSPSEPGPSSTKAPGTADIDKILKSEASAFQREVEVERILKAFKFKCVSSSNKPPNYLTPL